MSERVYVKLELDVEPRPGEDFAERVCRLDRLAESVGAVVKLRGWRGVQVVRADVWEPPDGG